MTIKLLEIQNLSNNCGEYLIVLNSMIIIISNKNLIICNNI